MSLQVFLHRLRRLEFPKTRQPTAYVKSLRMNNELNDASNRVFTHL